MLMFRGAERGSSKGSVRTNKSSKQSVKDDILEDQSLVHSTIGLAAFNSYFRANFLGVLELLNLGLELHRQFHLLASLLVEVGEQTLEGVFLVDNECAVLIYSFE